MTDEPIDIFGDPMRDPLDAAFANDTRTPKDHVLLAANQFRESLGDIGYEQVFRFDGLISAIETHVGARAKPDMDPPAEPQTATPLDGPEPVAIPLHWPVQIEGDRFGHLTLRPPRFADVEAVEKGEIAEIEMHARMAGVSVETLRQLRWSDFEVVTIVARHLAPAMRKR